LEDVEEDEGNHGKTRIHFLFIYFRSERRVACPSAGCFFFRRPRAFLMSGFDGSSEIAAEGAGAVSAVGLGDERDPGRRWELFLDGSEEA
jgi:hypothetical protein